VKRKSLSLPIRSNAWKMSPSNSGGGTLASAPMFATLECLRTLQRQAGR
jgi:hypothetical protein